MQTDTIDRAAIQQQLDNQRQWLLFHANKNVLSKHDLSEIDRLTLECRRLKELLRCAS